MKLRIAVVTACAAVSTLILSLFVAIGPAQAAVGLHISNGQLVEANGTPFVMRGTNFYYDYYLWQPHLSSSLADIKSLGANAVRVTLSGGAHPGQTSGVDDVARIVSLCKANKLICVLADADTTGYPAWQTEWTLDRAADYWISVKKALEGQENYILVNIANEPPPVYNDGTDWTSATTAAIAKLRNAGFDHTLVVDGGYGGDQQFVMRDNAQAVFNSDPDRNTLFSIHMYGPFDTAQKINAYLDSFQSRGLPLIIGEFGANSYDSVPVSPQPGVNGVDPGRPDTDTIMAQAVSRGIGYLGWSWNGNGTGPAPYLDQVIDFDVNRLTTWGQRLFNGDNGIRATSKQATV